MLRTGAALDASASRRSRDRVGRQDFVKPFDEFRNSVVRPPERQQVIASEECPIREQRFRRTHGGKRQLLIERTQLGHFVGSKGVSALQSRPWLLRSKRLGHRDVPPAFPSAYH